jgi:hypothetical protein
MESRNDLGLTPSKREIYTTMSGLVIAMKANEFPLAHD